MFQRWLLLVALSSVAAHVPETRAVQDWSPAAGRLVTRWAAGVSPSSVLPEYPRPQLVRQDWLNLNGLWDYAIRPKDEPQPAAFEGKLLVPFAVESALSGVMKPVGEANRLWYRRTFTTPAGWRGRTLLHFGAVDWDTTVIVNGMVVGQHLGGYDPFTFDISPALRPDGPQELVVSVWDPTDAGTQPRGKQVNRPRGIWYTAVTGIWQTVWIEPVPIAHVNGLVIVPDIDAGVVRVTANAAASAARVEVTASDGGRVVGRADGRPGEAIAVAIPSPRLWTPASPTLYDLEVTLLPEGDGGGPDRVTSYFAMRKSALCKDSAGIQRLCLNNEPVFQVGPLDQGWWPDGLYTAPTDEALRYDIEVTKQLGFNMARKHVKVEPERWYYWADRLGLMVWQDMPSANFRGPRPPESTGQFEAELKALIDSRRNHPSIVMWVPFNEGWGQYDTPRITNWVKTYDPSRLVNNASGWTDAEVGDVIDVHAYPGPRSPRPEPSRAAVLGEFGGLGLPLSGHTWQDEANWGYRSFTTPEALTDAYDTLLRRLHPLLRAPGLSAAVYTQTTDVEIEVNGLMTYDRAVIKPDAERVRAATLALFTPPPFIVPLVPASQEVAVPWRWTTSPPPADWSGIAFDDTAWPLAPAGFGTRNTPGTAVRTLWTTPDIWIRRTFDLPADRIMEQPHWLLHHDEDAEIFLNGVLVATVTGYSSDYELVPLSAEARAALRTGRNTIAVHCHQTTGGQYIDVGLVDVRPVRRR